LPSTTHEKKQDFDYFLTSYVIDRNTLRLLVEVQRKSLSNYLDISYIIDRVRLGTSKMCIKYARIEGIQ
jgi:hypothetical protein